MLPLAAGLRLPRPRVVVTQTPLTAPSPLLLGMLSTR